MPIRAPPTPPTGSQTRFDIFQRDLLLTALLTFLMLVQEIPKATASTKKPGRGTALYGRAALDSSAQQTRITRHLLELEQDNYHAIQIDIPKPESTPLSLYLCLLYRCILRIRCVPAFVSGSNCSSPKTTQNHTERAQTPCNAQNIDKSPGRSGICRGCISRGGSETRTIPFEDVL